MLCFQLAPSVSSLPFTPLPPPLPRTHSLGQIFQRQSCLHSVYPHSLLTYADCTRLREDFTDLLARVGFLRERYAVF